MPRIQRRDANQGQRNAAREDFRALVAAQTLGKRLPEALYVHISAIVSGSALDRLLQEALAIWGTRRFAYDVVKLSTRSRQVSFLSYPAFFTSAFPILSESATVDLETRQVSTRSYPLESNPPVLHRKELLLAPDHPRRLEFERLTAAAESAGLFEDTASIGQIVQWEETLRAKGLEVRGHALFPAQQVSVTNEVLRYRTAIRRRNFSTPVQAILRGNFLQRGLTLFDYGCGHGQDVRELQARNFQATGWDPFFAPDAQILEADVVNLGFVLNVIEDPSERLATLKHAYALARRLLVVGVLMGGRTAAEATRLYQDGVITSRNTFQKYFGQDELREYVRSALQREPIAVAPGVFFVFRDDAEEQQHLFDREQLPFSEVRLQTASVPAPHASLRPRRLSKWQANMLLIERFWAVAERAGRLPLPSEFDELEALRVVGTPKAVLKRLIAEKGESSFLGHRQARRDALLVFLALNVFEKRTSFRMLSDSIQADIREHFGNYRSAIEAGRALLFSAGNRALLSADAKAAAAARLGYLEGTHAFFFYAPTLVRLPPLLRVTCACASRICGDIAHADIVKVHLEAPKISLMRYDGFLESPLPLLRERVKVDLARQGIDIFEYGSSGYPSQYLYLKSRYLPPDAPYYEEQAAFDRTLNDTGHFDLRGFGPTPVAFEEGLRAAGLRIEGFHLLPV